MPKISRQPAQSSTSAVDKRCYGRDRTRVQDITLVKNDEPQCNSSLDIRELSTFYLPPVLAVRAGFL